MLGLGLGLGFATHFDDPQMQTVDERAISGRPYQQWWVITVGGEWSMVTSLKPLA